jgi:predicted nucleotidyltransferase
MKKTTALAVLRKISARLKKEFHVQALYLFGSTARDEAGTKSDVDILVEFSSRGIGFIEFIQLKNYLELVLKAKVDLVTRDSVKSWVLADLEKDAVRAA